MFEFSPDSNYSMPAHFGGTEGEPRSWTYADVSLIAVDYETELELLARYVPERFEITEPVIKASYAMVRGVEWMAGGSYTLIAVDVPVAYPTLYPIENVFTAGWRAEGKVQWQALSWEQHPTQAHIIDALSQLPIKAYRDCTITAGSQMLRVDTARELS